MRKAEILAFINVLAGAILLIILCPGLPDELVTAWGDEAWPLGGMSKSFFEILYIGAILGIFTVFVAMSRVSQFSPQTKQTQLFYGIGLNLMLLAFHALFLAMVLWNRGISCNFFKVMAVVLGVILFFMGIVIRRSQRHWFISFPTPWTKRDKQVWSKTHELLGTSFCIIGLCTTVIGVITWYSLFLAVNLIALAVVIAFIYSYFGFLKIRRRNE